MKNINIPIVLTVAAISSLSLVLFFVGRQKDIDVAPVVLPVATDSTDMIDDISYYNQVADDFIATLPLDKRVIARLVDDTNHCVIYYESGFRPSCYLYDLESMTTSVIFGGGNGFYIDTRLLIVGSVSECRRVGEWAVFICTNDAPETNVMNAAMAFRLNVYTHEMVFVDEGAAIKFLSDTQLDVEEAHIDRVSFFTGETDFSYTHRQIDLF